MAVVLLQRYASRRNVYHGSMIARIEPKRLTGWRNAVADEPA